MGKTFLLKFLPSKPKLISPTLPSFLQVAITPPKVKSWEAFICLFSGSINSLCLFATFEYFTSNYYKPVRSMISLSGDDPSLALLSSDVMGTLP